jgi:cell division protein FtsL
MFSVRALVFALVLVMAFVLVYPTLNSYLRQQSQLAELNAQVAAARERNEDLQADVDRWSDPAYVAAQARERLSFVLPGETPYRVVDPETVPDAPEPIDAPASGLDAGSTQPWYGSVWESVEVAGALPVVPDPLATEPATTSDADGGTGKASKPTSGDSRPSKAPADD